MGKPVDGGGENIVELGAEKQHNRSHNPEAIDVFLYDFGEVGSAVGTQECFEVANS